MLIKLPFFFVSNLDTILIKENGVAFRPLRKFCQLFVAVSFDTAKNSGIMRTKSCFSARRQPVFAALRSRPVHSLTHNDCTRYSTISQMVKYHLFLSYSNYTQKSRPQGLELLWAVTNFRAIDEGIL